MEASDFQSLKGTTTCTTSATSGTSSRLQHYNKQRLHRHPPSSKAQSILLLLLPLLVVVVLFCLAGIDNPSKLQQFVLDTTYGNGNTKHVQQVIETPPPLGITISNKSNNRPRIIDTKRIEAIHATQGEACRRVPTSIEAFIRDVHDHPEEQGLRRWTTTMQYSDSNNPEQQQHQQQQQQPSLKNSTATTSSSSGGIVSSLSSRNSNNHNNNQWIFPKLNMDLLDAAFANKRIAFVGDSTTFYLMRWIHHLLHIIPAGYLEHLTDRKTSTQAHRAAEEYMKRARPGCNIASPAGVEDVSEFYYDNHAHFLWKGFHGSNVQQNCQFETLVWQDVRDHQPDIIIANWGIHTLWNPHLKLCNVVQFIHYETLFLERIVKLAQEETDQQTKLILFKNVNLICHADAKKRAIPPQLCPETLWRWREEARHNNNNNNNNMNDATAVGANLTDADLDRYCREAQFSDVGAQLLNERLRIFVDKINNNNDNNNHNNIAIAIYNDHDMERCDYTQWNDGFHYQLMAFPRIRLLAHMISCLWKATS